MNNIDFISINNKKAQHKKVLAKYIKKVPSSLFRKKYERLNFYMKKGEFS